MQWVLWISSCIIPEFLISSGSSYPAISRSRSRKRVFIFQSWAFKLEAFMDADWADSVDDRRPTFGCYTFIGDNLVTWPSKKRVIKGKEEERGFKRRRRWAKGENGQCRQQLSRVNLHSHLICFLEGQEMGDKLAKLPWVWKLPWVMVEGRVKVT